MRIEPWKALLIIDEERELAELESIMGVGSGGEGGGLGAGGPATFNDLWEEDESEGGGLGGGGGRWREKSRSTSGTFSFMGQHPSSRDRRRSREASSHTVLNGGVGEGSSSLGVSVGPTGEFNGVGGGVVLEDDGSEEEKSPLYRMFIEAAKPSRS